MRIPRTKNDAPATQRGIWRKIFTSPRIRTKLCFMFLVKLRQCGRPLQRGHKSENSQSIQEEIWTVKRSRNQKVVLTAIGEVLTHEEAQVFVHGLNQFVTVQLLEEASAVLSLGKLYKDHGYSYEWASVQEPRLTIHGKSIICKTDNFVPPVAPGLSVNSGSSSSSTTLPQESLEPDARLVSGNRAASSSSSVLERSDEHARKKLGQTSLSDDKQDAKDPFPYMPFWLGDFTDDLKVSELPAPAHSSRDPNSEHPTKVGSKLRKHSVYTHFPKDRNCDVCLRTKITMTPCRRRGTVASTESCLHRQLDGIWEGM